MATPDVLPLRSDISFAAGSREEILETWDARDRRAAASQIRYGAEVTQLKGQKGAFAIGSRTAATFAGRARRAGDRPAGQPAQARRAGRRPADGPVPARRSGRVRGRDHRRDRRGRCGDRERARAGQAEPRHHHQPAGGVRARQERQSERDREGDRDGRIECFYNAAPRRRLEPGADRAARRPRAARCRCDRVIARLGADPPRRFVESCGDRLPEGQHRARTPRSAHLRDQRAGPLHHRRARRLSADQAGDEPGLRGRRDIPGHPVEPADEPLLHDKLLGMPGRLSVAEALDEIKTVQLFQGLTTLQLREFMLDSDMHVPARRRSHLRAQRLHQHVLLHRRGQGPDRARDDAAGSAVPHGSLRTRASSSARWA